MAKRKTEQTHPNNALEPHIAHIVPPGAPGDREAAGGAMVVSSPSKISAIVRTLRPREAVTLDDLHAAS